MKRSNPKNIYIHIKGKKSWNLVFLGEFLISIVFVGGFEEFVNCSISISGEFLLVFDSFSLTFSFLNSVNQ